MPEEPEDYSLEKLERGVPSIPLQGEIMPPIPSISPEVRWFRRPAVRVFGLLSVLSLASFLLSSFLQMRGVMNDIASRVCLVALVALLIGTLWSIAFSVKKWRGFAKALAVAASLALILAAYKVDLATLHRAKYISTNSDSDDDAQFGIFNLKPEQKAQLDSIKNSLFRVKAEILDTSTYREEIIVNGKLRDLTESLEGKYKCLLDVKKYECLPKPPPNLKGSGAVDVNVSFSFVADELSKNRAWMIHNNLSKLRVPILLYVTITNTTSKPIKVDLLYLEAQSATGWADVRMSDTLSPNADINIEKKPLLYCGENACASLKGDYLLPSLYDRVVQPGTKIDGWVAAEYPKGIKYGSSIGQMRISIVSRGHWIATKSFPANPPMYGKYLDGPNLVDFYSVPIDTLITEDQ